MLATLSSVFLIKESVEHLLEGEQHSHPHRLYMVGAFAASLSLEIAAYAVKNQPFQHVLTASSSSSLQVCVVLSYVPGKYRHSHKVHKTYAYYSRLSLVGRIRVVIEFFFCFFNQF